MLNAIEVVGSVGAPDDEAHGKMDGSNVDLVLAVGLALYISWRLL